MGGQHKKNAVNEWNYGNYREKEKVDNRKKRK
jgi:hypothetical protein